MTIWNLFELLGGLALFLFGMDYMAQGLELVAGDRMQSILNKLTSNRFLGILVGFIVTAIIQSSSATTVMVVGFVNSQLMTLSQAINVIMGANIGTTVTGLFIALNISALAPAIAFVGFILSLQHKSKVKYTARIIMGIGFLFMGLDIMATSMTPLQTSPTFLNFIQTLSSPILAILFGAFFTAIIQSSSASVGILQTLARQGLVPFSVSFYIVLGQNIGTCITAVLASINGKKNAKRAALSHVLFNVIGTLIFTLLSFALPLVDWFASLAPNAPAAQIAFMHTIFNVSITLILCPFADKLAHLSTVIISGEDPEELDRRLVYLTPSSVGSRNVTTPVLIANIERELGRLLGIIRKTLKHSMALCYDYHDERADQVKEDVKTIRFIDKEINRIVVREMGQQLSKSQSAILSNDLAILSNMERLADYADQMVDQALENQKDPHPFSRYAQDEIKEGMAYVDDFMKILDQRDQYEDLDVPAAELTDTLEDALNRYRNNHVDRISRGICSAESGMQYSFILMAMSRMGAHLQGLIAYVQDNELRQA